MKKYLVILLGLLLAITGGIMVRKVRSAAKSAAMELTELEIARRENLILRMQIIERQWRELQDQAAEQDKTILKARGCEQDCIVDWQVKKVVPKPKEAGKK